MKLIKMKLYDEMDYEVRKHIESEIDTIVGTTCFVGGKLLDEINMPGTMRSKNPLLHLAFIETFAAWVRLYFKMDLITQEYYQKYEEFLDCETGISINAQTVSVGSTESELGLEPKLELDNKKLSQMVDDFDKMANYYLYICGFSGHFDESSL